MLAVPDAPPFLTHIGTISCYTPEEALANPVCKLASATTRYVVWIRNQALMSDIKLHGYFLDDLGNFLDTNQYVYTIPASRRVVCTCVTSQRQQFHPGRR